MMAEALSDGEMKLHSKNEAEEVFHTSIQTSGHAWITVFESDTSIQIHLLRRSVF